MRIFLTCSLLLCGHFVSLELPAQTFPLELRQELTPFHLQSERGVPISSNDNDPGSDGRAPTDAQQRDAGLTTTSPTGGQFQGFIAFGALAVPSNRSRLNSGVSYAANAEVLDLPRAKSNTVVVIIFKKLQVGAPYLSERFTHLFGSVIQPPDTTETGASLAGSAADYWLPEPYTTTGHTNSGYYWSPHARRVYAIQAGQIAVTWKKAAPTSAIPQGENSNLYVQESGNYYRLYTVHYLVSGSAAQTPRKMYWTQGVFAQLGKPVMVPKARVGAVNIVYNENFPERVAEEYLAPGQSQFVTGTTNQLQETRTLWYDHQQSLVLAYNIEGRVFLELLGDARPDGRTRTHLGYEIVDVFRQQNPAGVTIDLGERLNAYEDGRDDSDLVPEPLNRGRVPSFFFEHNLPATGGVEFFATRETVNLNDVLVHWMEEGALGLRWPSRLVRYRLSWPNDPARYSHYIRPLVDSDAEARETAIHLPIENVPVIEYQDGDRAKLTADFKFYTYLDEKFPAHRTLLRYSAADQVAFERVFSVLAGVVKTPSFDGSRDSGLNPSIFAGPGANGILDLNPAVAAYGQLPSGVYFEGGSFTVESWVYVRSIQNWARLFDFGNGPVSENVVLALSDGTSGRPKFHVFSGSSQSWLHLPSPLPLNQWVHLAAVFNAATAQGQIFLNGTQQVSGPMIAPANVTRQSAFVGRSNWSNDDYADAQFDNLRIWSEARTPEQIAEGMGQVYPAGTSNLVAQYQFSEEHATTGGENAVALDSSGHERTMTLFHTTLALPPRLTRARFTDMTVSVGERLAPPAGESAGATSLAYLSGYVFQPGGTSFNVSAYQDPFAAGFDAANLGAIIPVNAIPGSNRLEVWWFRPNAANLERGFKTVFWPSVIGQYTVQWPANAPEIILASNDGSGALPSLAQKGRIYYQNDKLKPGYNPNEEHALMSGGQAYALRDDLNITSGPDYSSEPFVLLEYQAADGRPTMTAFRVLREKPEEGVLFDYITEAGKVLQAPMPLPLLAPPVEGTGSLAVNYNTEPDGTDGDLPVNWVPATHGSGPYGHYKKFTYRDRKESFWVYRGLHAGAPTLEAGKYNTTSKAFEPLPAATAIVGEDFSYTIHASRRSEGLSVEAATGSTLPAWLSIDGLTLKGRPVEDNVGSSTFSLIISAMDDGSRVTKSLTVTVAENGNVVTQGSLQIVSNNTYAGGDVTYVGRPPYLANSPVPTNCFTMRFYYMTQEGFAWPGLNPVPTNGSIVPYLRPKNSDESASSKNTASLDIVFRPVWPIQTPKMAFGETLTLPKKGLPAVRGQTSLQVLYQQSIATNITKGDVSVLLHDPTREKTYDLNSSGLDKLPNGVRTDTHQGKTYFPGLPPHLSQRFYFDPNRNTNGSLVFRGEFKDEPLGEKYLLLNVLRGADLDAVKSLCPASPAGEKGKWDVAIDRLATTVETFKEDTTKPGTFIVDTSPSTAVGDLTVITDSNTAVDSYALSASGPGSGYVTLIAGNGLPLFTPEGEPVSLEIIRVTGQLYVGEIKIIAAANPLDEQLTFQHTADLAGKFDEYEYDWRIGGLIDGLAPSLTESMTGWEPLANGLSLPRYVLGGTGVRVLKDNAVVMRYRPINTAHPLRNQWSDWTEPQLAEGWIKRVLAGINPFNQRTRDLFNNPVSTEASMLTQAGPRWEGNVALNLANINDFGLIEIYETVLKRGRMLSIGADINDPGANDALLLAAGYLNDLYMMLGNEAWADAADPTIGIGTKDRTYGEIATALFAFKGQMASLLEEELALLRGRDDFVPPGVQVTPVYNRLIWNYTRGIDAGEVIYALNYNIQEKADTGFDGIINADDARKLYPQGHGDAYGHYLTALKGYYSLLTDTDFTWVPRTEAVTVLGKPVQVDYLDERKFAAAAAAVARTGKQIFDLTWRKDQYRNAPSWDYYFQSRTNHAANGPGRVRYWGMDHWASRTGAGAYVNWVMGNAMLPEVDTDTQHEGIQKIDRTTVPELTELASLMESLQIALDNAEGDNTPLGFPNQAIAFDINPAKVVAAENGTHFEQIYDRAKVALNNAVVAFDDTKNMTRLMRSEQDSLADFQARIGDQERAYQHALIELYGTPYPDDIGPGRTYVTDYAGPDLVHFMYVDNPEIGDSSSAAEKGETFQIDIQDLPEKWGKEVFTDLGVIKAGDEKYAKDTHYIEFTLNSHGFFQKPSTWTGKRKSPGKVQQAISRLIMAHNRVSGALDDARRAKADLDATVRVFEARKSTLTNITRLETEQAQEEQAIDALEYAYDLLNKTFESTLAMTDLLKEMLVETPPKSLIFGLATGGDVAAPIRGIMLGVSMGSTIALRAADIAVFASTQAVIRGRKANILDKSMEIANLQLDQDLKDAVLELGAILGEMQDHLDTINEKLRELDDAAREYSTLLAEGDRIQSELLTFRQRSAGVVQGFRTRDAAFRIFRNEKLERYKTLFDLAARYAFLAVSAYDYETGVLQTPKGEEFVRRVVRSRALGVIKNGEPQFAGSNTGDPGLSSVMAEMKADWDALKGRLGFNNPDTYGTTVSLRTENFRILPGGDSDAKWRDELQRGLRDNLLEDENVRMSCMQLATGDGLPVPGIILSFSTSIAERLNLFGQPLASGDHMFSRSSFATKIFAVGVAFDGYRGMDDPSANSSAVGFGGGSSPADPSLAFLDPNGLAATPYVYLIPVGVDSMRTPALGDRSEIHTWDVADVTIPMPFNIGGAGFSDMPFWQSSEALSEELFGLRKHQAFRAVSSPTVFSGDLVPSQYTNRRLIGRSVWNSQWKLVIPGDSLLNDPKEGLDRFIRTVKDIKLHFVTYSYAGN